MKHLAAYALLVLGGKAKPTEADVKKLLKDAGCTCDDEKVKALIEKAGDKEFHEHAKAGLDKMSTMGSGPAAAGGAAAASAGPAKVEEKAKEEEPEDVDMGGLFGDDEDDY